MAGTCKKNFSVSEVLFMLDMDHTQSGSDLDINYLYDESDSNISDLDGDLKNTYLLKNIWKGINLYASQRGIPSQ